MYLLVSLCSIELQSNVPDKTPEEQEEQRKKEADPRQGRYNKWQWDGSWHSAAWYDWYGTGSWRQSWKWQHQSHVVKKHDRVEPDDISPGMQILIQGLVECSYLNGSTLIMHQFVDAMSIEGISETAVPGRSSRTIVSVINIELPLGHDLQLRKYQIDELTPDMHDANLLNDTSISEEGPVRLREQTNAFPRWPVIPSEELRIGEIIF